MPAGSLAPERGAGSGFVRFAGLCAILAGLAGFLYAVAFVILARGTPALGGLLSALFLLLLGLLATPELVALYERLRETDAPFALWGTLLALVGAAGAAIHGGYDLANAIHPPTTLDPNAPSQIDPRGLLTFGVESIGLLVLSWLIGRTPGWPRGLAWLGYLSAILLLALYLGRLIVLDPANPIILVPAIANGFVVEPFWYVWLGLTLARARD